MNRMGDMSAACAVTFSTQCTVDSAFPTRTWIVRSNKNSLNQSYMRPFMLYFFSFIKRPALHVILNVFLPRNILRAWLRFLRLRFGGAEFESNGSSESSGLNLHVMEVSTSSKGNSGWICKYRNLPLKWSQGIYSKLYATSITGCRRIHVQFTVALKPKNWNVQCGITESNDFNMIIVSAASSDYRAGCLRRMSAWTQGSTGTGSIWTLPLL